ncbi:MAG: ester cyclase [Chloroflexota bacterium]|nr:MAG: ester cyclase [Chloroflexota bacterium]
MSTATNKAIVRRYLEQVFNERRIDLCEEFLVEDYQIYGAGIVPGREAAKEWQTMIGAAFPDMQLTFEDMIAEGDKVVIQGAFCGTHQGELFGIPATGKWVIQPSVFIFRLAKGEIVEGWYAMNDLDLMQQLGVLPAPQVGQPV